MKDGDASGDELQAERALLRESVRQQRTLSEVSRILLDYTGEDELEPLRRVVDKVVEAMGDWCSFSLIQPDGILKNVVTFHPDPLQRERSARFNALIPPSRWDRPPVEHNALLQKRPVFFEHIPDELLRAGMPSVEAYELIREIGLTSIITAPMLLGGEPLGTLSLASSGPGGRRYSEHDVDFVYSLAGRSALAVRNARLVKALSQERGEAERRAAELLAVLQADPNGIALFGPDDRLRFASPSLDALIGQPYSKHIGKSPFELLPLAWPDPLLRERRVEQLREIFARRDQPTREDLTISGPPVRYIVVTTTPVNTASGTYLGRLFVYADITLERELDLKRSEFLTVAAHELRTPLTPLSMYLQALERKLARGQSVEPELVTKARRQVSRLERLVQDLLDLSRIESGQVALRKQELSLDALAEEVAADFTATARVHRLELKKPPHPVLVDADRERLEQVLVNLLANAFKYSPQGGLVIVGVEERSGEAVAWVTDQGIGVPPEEKAQLFRRFFRARNAATSNYGGLGIGLYVSNDIVVRHGGRFEVDSEPAGGTTFRFFLPLAAKTLQQRVLLVDDDLDILEATAGFLTDEGYLVDRARDGEQALAALAKARPSLMLVDLMMPVLDGWSLIERLRAENLAPGVPIVVFSADSDVRKQARELKADALLKKPFSLDELLEVVHRLIGGVKPTK